MSDLAAVLSSGDTPDVVEHRSRAAERRALRAAGYRGSKSTRNKMSKTEAEQFLALVRWSAAHGIAEARAAHFATTHGIVRRRSVCNHDGEEWPCRASVALDQIEAVSGA